MGRQEYSSNQSSTYSPNGSYASASYWAVRYTGILSQDTVSIAGVEIQNQMFEEYTDSHMISIGGMDVGFDGMLGLAPPWSEEQNGEKYPNYLSLLMKEEKLEENVFSLRYPTTLEEQGELMLGGSNSNLYTGSFRNISLLPDDVDTPGLQGGWTVPLSSITLNTPHPLHLPTPNYTAALVSEPLLILPTAFARNITKIIGAEPFYLWLQSVPCDRRPYLPTLTFEIEGQEFTIDAWDYTFEWSFGMPEGSAPMCAVWIGESGDYGLGEGVVGLGTAFLKRWYSRWDFEGRRIGRKFLI